VRPGPPARYGWRLVGLASVLWAVACRSTPPVDPLQVVATLQPANAESSSETTPTGTGSSTLELTSPAFAPGSPIPIGYSCDGTNASPPLEWNFPPAEAQSFALIVDDPDAPGQTWVHWVIFNIPGTSASLPEGVPTEPELANGVRQGVNSGGGSGYAGPCPPGGTHRYFFRLYALDSVLDLAPGLTAEVLTLAMTGHILSTAELMGTYGRK